MLFSYHLLYFCTALSLIIMLSSHYHHYKSKTFSQLTQCPFTGTLLLFYFTMMSKTRVILIQILNNYSIIQIFVSQGIHRVIWHFLPKSFPAIFVGHLEFLHKIQKHILETVWDRAILTKFLVRRVNRESSYTFCQRIVSLHFSRLTWISV